MSVGRTYDDIGEEMVARGGEPTARCTMLDSDRDAYVLDAIEVHPVPPGSPTVVNGVATCVETGHRLITGVRVIGG